MKTIRIFLISLVAILATGCTHNNGDIGFLFGQWIMTDITADGIRPADIVPTDWNWRFQNGILEVSHVDQVSHESADYWSSWMWDGDELRVNFGNSDVEISYLYAHPAQIGFTEPTLYRLSITERKDDKMTLQMVNPQGVTYVYTFKKLN